VKSFKQIIGHIRAKKNNKWNLSFFSLYKFSISATKRQGNTATCVEVEVVANRLQRYVKKDWLVWDLNSRPPAHEARALTDRPSRRYRHN